MDILIHGLENLYRWRQEHRIGGSIWSIELHSQGAECAARVGAQILGYTDIREVARDAHLLSDEQIAYIVRKMPLNGCQIMIYLRSRFDWGPLDDFCERNRCSHVM